MKSLPRNMTGRLAVFSACGKNRYWLRRNLTGDTGKHVLWIMMNPSRANETANDATTTMTTNVSRRHGYDVHGVVNLSAVIEADSTKLTATDGAADLLNDQAISRALSWIRRQRGDIVVAWGASRHLKHREAQVLSQLRRQNLLCLGHNHDGSPKFPRGIRRDARLKSFTR